MRSFSPLPWPDLLLVMAWTVVPSLVALFLFLVSQGGGNVGGPALAFLSIAASSLLGFRHLQRRSPEQYAQSVVVWTSVVSALVVAAVLTAYRWFNEPGWTALGGIPGGLLATFPALLVGGVLASPRNLRSVTVDQFRLERAAIVGSGHLPGW